MIFGVLYHVELPPILSRCYTNHAKKKNDGWVRIFEKKDKQKSEKKNRWGTCKKVKKVSKKSKSQ